MKFVELPDPISVGEGFEVATSINVGGAAVAARTLLEEGKEIVAKGSLPKNIGPDHPIGIRVRPRSGEWIARWLTEDEAIALMRALAQALQRVADD